MQILKTCFCDIPTPLTDWHYHPACVQTIAQMPSAVGPWSGSWGDGQGCSTALSALGSACMASHWSLPTFKDKKQRQKNFRGGWEPAHAGVWAVNTRPQAWQHLCGVPVFTHTHQSVVSQRVPPAPWGLPGVVCQCRSEEKQGWRHYPTFLNAGIWGQGLGAQIVKNDNWHRLSDVSKSEADWSVCGAQSSHPTPPAATTHLVHRSPQASQHRQHLNIHFSCIGLPCDDESPRNRKEP